jgi:hypothetical protein
LDISAPFKVWIDENNVSFIFTIPIMAQTQNPHKEKINKVKEKNVWIILLYKYSTNEKYN